MQKLSQSIKKQKGAVLILIAFIIGLATAAYLLHALNPERLRVEQDKKTMQALNEAKQALIAWAVNHPNMPGLMPYPDRNNDGNYDDRSDCYANNVNFNSIFTLGRLPLFKNDPNCVTTDTIDTSGVHDTQVVNGLSADLRDGTGERLWYEVSSNLLHDYKSSAAHSNGASPEINPSIINNPNPIYPWFVVRDRNRVIISDRVAAVIIAPGAPSGAQDRSGGIANPNQYLDKIMMADNTPYQNYGYQNPATNPVQEFIIGDDYRVVAKNDPTYKDQTVEPYYYNDKLVYITIDELMYAIEKRVLEQTKVALSKFKIANGFYPFAADLGFYTSPNPNQNQCTQGNLRGLLPVNTPSTHTCSCTSSTRTCNCNLGVVNSISFTRSSGTFVATGGGANAPTGACSVSPLSTNTCTCNGAGGCKRATGAEQFRCDACGICIAKVVGTNRFSTTGTFTNSTGVCTFTSNQAICANSANGTFTLKACNVNETIVSLPAAGGLLPAWFTANQWEKYIVYAVSSDCTSTGTCLANTSPPKITIESNTNINAIVAGSLVNPNNSCNIANYLSSAENTNAIVSNGLQDLIYQKSQVKTLANTDQLVMIP